MFFMRSSEKLYEHIFNTMAQGVFQSTPKGQYLRVNSALARLYGYSSPIEMIKSVNSISRQIFAEPGAGTRYKRLLEKENAIESYEARHKRKDGTIIWTSTTAHVVRDTSGKTLYYIGFVQDVTSQKQTRDAIEYAEAHFRVLVEQSPVAVYIEAPRDNFNSSIYISPQIETITGFTPAEWNMTGFWFASVHPEDQKRFIEENERTNITGESFDMEYRIIRKDGRIIWVRDIAKLAHDSKGNPIYWHGTLIDITDQKNLQSAIHQSEDRFQKAFRASPIATSITTLDDGVFRDVNEAYLRLSGFQREQIIGHSATELHFLDGETRTKWLKEFLDSGSSLHRQNFPFITASGQQLKTIAFYDGIEVDGQKAILSMFYDITNQSQAETALQQSETRYQALVEHIPAIVYIDDPEKEQITRYISPQVETITGFTPQEWISDPYLWMNRIHPEDRERVMKKDAETKKNHEPFKEEYRFITKGGRAIWVQEESSLIRDEAGNPLFWQGFLLDITSKKEAQDALGEVASTYRGLFDSVTDAIFIQDRSGHFLDVNIGTIKMFGYPREFYLGQTLDILGAPGKNKVESLQKAMKSAFNGTPQQYDFWGLHRNGDIFPIDVHLYKGTYFGQDVIFAITRDITERRKTQDAQERQLRELSVLHALTIEGTNAANEEELIERATDIIGNTLYTDLLGFLMLNDDGKSYSPHLSYQGNINPEISPIFEIGKGVTGQVAATGKPLNIKDVRKIREYIEIDPKTRSELCVPMKIGERVIGIINAESTQEDFFTTDDERLLSTIAGQVATVIERLRSERAEREQRMLAEALQDTASVLNSTLDLNTVLDLILENIDRVVPSETAMIMLVQNGLVNPIRQRGYAKRGLENWIKELKLPSETFANIKHAIATHQPQLIPDVLNEPEWVYLPETNWIRSYLVAPILVEQEVIGLISLDHDKPNFFDEQDKERLMAFANQAASAIENARLFEEESRRARIIEALAEIANVIATTRDTSAAMDEIAQRSLELLNAEDIAIYLLQDDDKTLKIVTAKGIYRDTLLSHTIQVGQGITGHIVETGKAEIVNNFLENPRRIRVPGTPEKDSEIETMMSAPLILREKPIGAINAWRLRTNGLFSNTELNYLVAIAHQASIAIESGRLLGEISRQAQETAAIAEVGRDISSTLQLDVVLERIAAYAKELLHAETSAVYLTEPTSNVLRGIAAIGAEAVEIKNDPIQLGTGILGNIAIQMVGEIVNDTLADPRAITIKGTEPNTNEHIMGVPVVLKDQLTGLLVVWRIGQERDFKPPELSFLASLAQQAAIAIENARLFEEESRRARIIEALAEIANVIATTRDTSAAMDEIAQRSLELLNASNIAVYLLQDDDKTLKIVTAKGTYQDMLLSHTIQIGQGITGHIVETGKAEIVDTTITDPRRVLIPGTSEKDSESETMMSAPLILREKPIGAINAWRLRTNGLFSETELNYLVAIAHQASIAIESGRLFGEISRRAQETTAIAEVGRDISSTLKLDVVLERIAAYAKELLHGETSAVYLTEPKSNDLRAIAAIGVEAVEIKNDPIQLGKGILGNIATQMVGEIVNDTFADPRSITVKGTETDPYEHIMGVPVVLKDQLTGLLVVWRVGKELEFKPTELSFLTSLAQQAAIAIENARLFRAEQQRRQEAETLREATAIVATTLEREHAIELILEQLAHVLPYDSASIQLLRDGYLEIVGGRGWQFESSILGIRFPIPGDNPNTVVIQERRPVFINSIYDIFESFRRGPHSRIQSWLGVPFIAHGEVIGMLSVDSIDRDYFNEEKVRLATAYANQAAITIDNAELHEKSEYQIRRLTALRDVDTAIASSLDLRVTLNILMDNAASQLRADAMSILIYNNNLQVLETIASVGFRGGSTRRQFRIGEGLAGKIAINRKPLHVQELSQTEYSNMRWLSEEKFVTYSGYPLLGKGQVKGVLEAFFRAPFTPDNDWLEFIQTIVGQAAIAIDNAQMFENLQRSNQELSLAYDTTLEGWGKALELRDKETEGHTRRVTELTVRLARRLNVNDSDITHIHRGVLLHDIGKMGVPDQILRKTGPLDESEWEQMRKHPQYAYDLLYPITYLRPALDIPFCHHEKWDGSGYPRSLKGEEIPLAARIFAIVDVWDALLSDRPYRKTWSRERTIDYITKEAGTRFDPTITRTFLEMISEVE
jgi:PAS domain S-box-containing protein